jgi:hypothetical protein
LGPGLRTPAIGVWRVDGAHVINGWDGKPADHDRTAVPAYQTCITAMIDAVVAGARLRWPVATLRSLAMLDAALLSAGNDGQTVAVEPIPGGPW